MVGIIYLSSYIMQAKHILLLALLVAVSLGQAIKLTEFIKAAKPIIDIRLPKLPTNCASADSNNICTACVEGYQLFNQSCEKVT